MSICKTKQRLEMVLKKDPEFKPQLRKKKERERGRETGYYIVCMYGNITINSLFTTDIG
jgi:hypothetical protein